MRRLPALLATGAAAVCASAVLVTPQAASAATPSSSNTGVPAGVTLKQHYGNMTITKSGTVIDAMDIHGFVTVKATNVTIKRSIVRGGVATYNVGLITNYGYSGLVVQDVDLVPEHPSVWLDAIKGNNFTATRVDARGTVDTAKVHGNNVTIQNSYLHDTKYYSSDPNQGGKPSHNDGVQILGGSNIKLLNNTIVGSSNTAIMVTQDYARTSGLTISGNYLDNGTCTINMNHKKLSSMSGISITGNTFGRHQTQSCAVIATKATSYSRSANKWADTGAAIAYKVS